MAAWMSGRTGINQWLSPRPCSALSRQASWSIMRHSSITSIAIVEARQRRDIPQHIAGRIERAAVGLVEMGEVGRAALGEQERVERADGANTAQALFLRQADVGEGEEVVGAGVRRQKLQP